MASDTKDAREDVLTDILHGWDPLEPPPYPKEVVEMLDRLDAADPLRAMLPQIMEVVGWVAGAAMVQGYRAQMTDPHATHRLSPGAWLTIDTRSGVESTRRTRAAATLYEQLTRLRTLTPTDGV